jgi:flagellar biosynthesis protein FliQ
MEIRRRTWIAALKLAVVVSLLSAIVAVAASTLGDVPAVAIVLPVIVVAFSLSWVQTGRLLRGPDTVRAELVPGRRHTAPIG